MQSNSHLQAHGHLAGVAAQVPAPAVANGPHGVADAVVAPVIAGPHPHHAARGLPVPGMGTIDSLSNDPVIEIARFCAPGSASRARLAQTSRRMRELVTPLVAVDIRYLEPVRNPLHAEPFGFLDYSQAQLFTRIDEAHQLTPALFVKTYERIAHQINNICDDHLDPVPLLEKLREGLQGTADQGLRFEAASAVTRQFMNQAFVQCPKTPALEAFYQGFLHDIDGLDDPARRVALRAESARGMHMLQDNEQRRVFWHARFDSALAMAEDQQLKQLKILVETVPTLANPASVGALDTLIETLPMLPHQTRAALIAPLINSCTILPDHEAMVVRLHALFDVAQGLEGPARELALAAFQAYPHIGD